MTETTDQIGSRRHSSRLAVASFVCAIVAVTCHFLFVRAERAQTEGLCLVFGLIGFACFLAGPILGVAALDKMPRSKRILSLKGLAMAGILISLCGVVLALLWPRGRTHVDARRLVCGAKLKALGQAITLYSGENERAYPQPSMWCDLLVECRGVAEHGFVCPGGKNGRCHYAMNPNCEPNSPPDMVLLFETKGGWNQHGGLEMLTTEHHREGCNVLLNDGTVWFIKKDRIPELKWKSE